MSDEVPPSEFRTGGLVLGPDGEDSLLAWIDPRYERVFTAEQVRRMSEGNQPGEG